MEEVSTRLARIAQGRPAPAVWRRAALDVLGEEVAFDAALFHELSPRAPLSRAGAIELDLEVLEATRGRWDDLAVELGALTQRALAQDGVATDVEAFGTRGRQRQRWDRTIARPMGIRSLLAAHLVIEGRIVSVVFLIRRRAPHFTAGDRERLARLVPVLAVCDHTVCEPGGGGPTRGIAVEVRCVDERLTPRQREIVELVAMGHTNREIGDALDISHHTVRNLLVKVRDRLGAANRADVVRLAVLYPVAPDQK